jgi:hypothetical protein
MSHLDGHNSELQARELGACLRDAALQDATVEHMAIEAERLRRALTQTAHFQAARGSLRKSGHWLLAAAAAFLFVVALGAWLRQRQHVVPLTFEVIGPGRVSANYVAALEHATATLKFTDGSTILAHPGARVSVPELRADGATLLLECGRTTVEVVHGYPTTRWTVMAGPFSIAVTGTKFDVEWAPATERLAVDMLEGRIEVDGPKFTAPATLLGGQHIEANSSDARWAVTPLLQARSHGMDPQALSQDPLGSQAADPEPRTASPQSGAATNETLARAELPPSKDSAASGSPRHALAVAVPTSAASGALPTPQQAKSWSRLVAQGESQRVVAEAESMGQKNCFGQCSSADLRALADASRYSGRLDLAEASLRALRDRFPAQAPVAAYLLGLVDEARGRNASALRWYEEYVSAAPHGGFVSEAFAGRLRMLVATHGYTSARRAAQQYLELYPKGVGVKTAKQVLESR